jgi:heat shock protein 90kDa beta
VKEETTPKLPTDDEDDKAKVKEEAETEKTPKTKKVSKTVCDWELMNDSKPVWTRKRAEVTQDEDNEFYKSLTQDTADPLTQTSIAEGEVTFKLLLFILKVQPLESFNKSDHIKPYVCRVFITDEFNDMMPNYLNFIRGIMNVSRETLQQHKLIKVIKMKLMRKALDLLKKLEGEEYGKFWNIRQTSKLT